jgi:multidrug resistance efflux pump
MIALAQINRIEAGIVSLRTEIAGLKLQQRSIMAKIDEIREELDGLRTDVGEIGPALENIAADIDRLSVPPTGGISEADAETLRTDLAAIRAGVQAVADKAKEVAAKTPDEPPIV